MGNHPIKGYFFPSLCQFLCVALTVLELTLDQAGLKLTEICLPLPLECWGYRYVPGSIYILYFSGLERGRSKLHLITVEVFVSCLHSVSCDATRHMASGKPQRTLMRG